MKLFMTAAVFAACAIGISTPAQSDDAVTQAQYQAVLDRLEALEADNAWWSCIDVSDHQTFREPILNFPHHPHRVRTLRVVGWITDRAGCHV